MKIILRIFSINLQRHPLPFKVGETRGNRSLYRLVTEEEEERTGGMESSRTSRIVETLIKMARNGTELRGCIWRARV